MASLPRHMHDLSARWWYMVDALKKNGFPEEQAYNVISEFFKQFEPLPRNKVFIAQEES